MRSERSINVTPADLERLEAIFSRRTTPQKHVWRARIVLLTAKGLGTNAIVRATGKSKKTVWRWQERFAEAGVAGLLGDKTRPPGKPPVPPNRVAEVVRLTQASPPHEATHWTARAMATATGLAVSTVQKIWKAHGLAPHRWRTFKLSNDPAFAEKLYDIAGLYVSPPAHAVVLSVDESEPRSAPPVRAPRRTQIQALGRTQPGLPMKKGRGATMTHDYKRNATTTLFAALNGLTGEVFGRNMARHRHQAFIRFLNALEREIPAGKVVHVVLDNVSSHKTPEVMRWLDRHPRRTFHFTPTSTSWLNAVEGFFAKLTKRRLKHGVFKSVVDLQSAINRFIAEHNETEAKPFIWRADPDAIVDAGKEGSKRWSHSTRVMLRVLPGHLTWGNSRPCCVQESKISGSLKIMLSLLSVYCG